ncbi:MAG: sensor histidine kinase [Opitutaceae bacterium]
MSKPHPSSSLAGLFNAWRRDFWWSIVSITNPSHRRRLVAFTFILVLVIGVADYLTGFELSLLVFYLLPICLAVASVGWRFGVVTSVLSIATWLTGDFAAGAHFSKTLVPVWNSLIALGTYLMVVWLLSSLLALQREMEARIRQRTAALTDEIAERERLERAILEISDRERRSIGHDLHDGLGQHLTGTALVAHALGARMADRKADEAQEMKKIIGLIEDGIEQTRNLAKGLLLAEIEREGLAIALQEFAAATSQNFRVECVCRCEGNAAFEENGTATHLYRIAQEAVRNAVRHGRAKRIDIALEDRGGKVVLSVHDDGTGLAPPGSRGEGLGLRIMTHRASIIGASLAVTAQPGGGTLVICTLARPVSRP